MSFRPRFSKILEKSRPCHLSPKKRPLSIAYHGSKLGKSWENHARKISPKMVHVISRIAFRTRPCQKCQIFLDFPNFWKIRVNPFASKNDPMSCKNLARNVFNAQPGMSRCQNLSTNIFTMGQFSLKATTHRVYESGPTFYLVNLPRSCLILGHIAGAKIAHFQKNINFLGNVTIRC